MTNIDVNVYEEVFVIFKMIEKVDPNFIIKNSLIKVRNLTEAIDMLVKDKDLRLVCRFDEDNNIDIDGEYLVIDEDYTIELDYQAETFQSQADEIIDMIYDSNIEIDLRKHSYLVCPKELLSNEWLGSLMNDYNDLIRVYNNSPLFVKELIIDSIYLLPDNVRESLIYKQFSPAVQINKTNLLKLCKAQEIEMKVINQII